MNHHKPHTFCWPKTHQTPLRHPPPSRNTGEVPNLFAPDERVQVCEMVRAAARAEGKAPEARVKRGFWKDEGMDQRPKELELTMIFSGKYGRYEICLFFLRSTGWLFLNLRVGIKFGWIWSCDFRIKWRIWRRRVPYICIKIHWDEDLLLVFCGRPVFRLLRLMIEG